MAKATSAPTTRMGSGSQRWRAVVEPLTPGAPKPNSKQLAETWRKTGRLNTPFASSTEQSARRTPTATIRILQETPEDDLMPQYMGIDHRDWELVCPRCNGPLDWWFANAYRTSPNRIVAVFVPECSSCPEGAGVPLPLNTIRSHGSGTRNQLAHWRDSLDGVRSCCLTRGNADDGLSSAMAQ